MLPLSHPTMAATLPRPMTAAMLPLSHPTMAATLPRLTTAAMLPLSHPTMAATLPRLTTATMLPLSHPTMAATLPRPMTAEIHPHRLMTPPSPLSATASPSIKAKTRWHSTTSNWMTARTSAPPRSATPKKTASGSSPPLTAKR
ncbi:hypothetical protein [Citrobacter portucalensis]|uniref:hypothetical protein n=1 Tax=Citrobacter portucalensis TaxID=1639133 RepID=UPI0015F190EB|nr:hypothetical protein [Citrobacter portucalensis]